MHNDTTNEPQEKPLLNILQQIKDGQLDPTNLDRETKLHCVELLRGEGQTIYQIAQITKQSERQIKRYIKEIKEKNSLRHDPEFESQFMGDLIARANNSFSHLLRLARSKDGSISEKAQAELAAWHILHGLAKFLQSSGYLPLRAHTVEGEFLHHFDKDKTDLLLQEIITIEKVAQETTGLPQPLQDLLSNTKKALEEQPKAQEGEKDVKDEQ